MNIIELPLQKAKIKGYICPVCGSGSGVHGTGITQIPGTDLWHCFACGLTADTQRLLRLAGQDNMDAVKKTAKRVAKDMPLKSYEGYFKTCEQRNGYKYLRKRGLSAELQKRFHIGFDPHWKNPKALENAEAKHKSVASVPESPRVIIPNGLYSYYARDTRDEIPKRQIPYAKVNVGPVNLYCPQKLDMDRPIFITEGQIDALSVCQAGGQAVALCGISNYKKIMGVRLPGRQILMLDMDAEGRKAQKKLKELLPFAVDLTYDFHDPNDFLLNDPGGIINLVYDI